jgi:N-acetylmuramoyl-L-alanine amidase
MFSLLPLLRFLILLWSTGLCFYASANADKFRIVIDPGHGGADNGAVYANVREADIALQISKLLKQELSQHSDVETYLTRDDDTTVSLQARVEKTNELNADLFLSLHANASPDLRARGIEFYFQNRLANDEESLYLAHLESQMVKEVEEETSESPLASLDKKSDILAIIEDMKRQTKMRQSFAASESLIKAWQKPKAQRTPPIKQAPFYVLAKNQTPAVLVEVGFLSNPHELKKLIDPNFHLTAAKKLAQGVLKFKEKMDKGQASRLQ